MRCSPNAWIFIFTSILGLGVVASAGGADNTSAVSCSSVCLDSLSDEASKLSKECYSAADSKRTSLLAEGQSEIVSAVRSTQQRLMKCGLNSDPLLFFRCLQNTMDEVRETLDEIVKNSTKLIAHHAVELSAIDKEETDCLVEVVRKSKLESDQAFAEYKECLATGSDCCCISLMASPSSTSSPITASTTSASSSPSFIPSTSSSTSPSSSSTLPSTAPSSSTPSTLSPDSSPSTSTAQPTEEESSMVDPEGEMGIPPRSTDGSQTLVPVTIASVVLVIILLIATYLYRKKATRSRFQLKTCS